MNTLDLSTFNKAIELERTGNKEAAHATLNKLRIYYPNDPNLLFWIAYTSTDLKEAKGALETISQVDPHNYLLENAHHWVSQLEQKQREEVKARAEARVKTLTRSENSVQIPFLFRQHLQTELAKGEKIIWAGRPEVKLLIKVLLVQRGIIFGLVLLAEVLLAAVASSLLLWLALPILALVAGLAIFTTPYLLYQQSSRTLYVLTDRRILLLSGAWLRSTLNNSGGFRYKGIAWKNFAAYERLELTKLTVLERENGTGDLYIDEEQDENNSAALPLKVGCIAVRNVASLKEQVEQVFSLKHTPDCPTSDFFWDSGTS
jgi:hypothetical protein